MKGDNVAPILSCSTDKGSDVIGDMQKPFVSTSLGSESPVRMQNESKESLVSDDTIEEMKTKSRNSSLIYSSTLEKMEGRDRIEVRRQSEFVRCATCSKNIPLAEWPDHRDRLKTVELVTDRVGSFRKLMVKLFIDFFMWVLMNIYFREVTVVGQENVPKDGAVIFYGNHQNQFIDAMMICANCDRPIRFVMAEKSFHRPIVGLFGRLMNAVPVVRPQDVPLIQGQGYLIQVEKEFVVGDGTNFLSSLSNGDVIIWFRGTTKCSGQVDQIFSDTELQLTMPVLQSNVVTQPTSFKISRRIDHSVMYASVYQTLQKNQCIGIFPEGGSHDRTSLLPLKAGVALFSLGAAERGINVKVVPCGLTYFYGHRFRSRAHVEFGEPITPSEELVELFSTNKREAAGLFLEHLNQELRSFTINVPNWRDLNFLHGFRQLYQPQNCILATRDYLRLSRRLSVIMEAQKDNPEFMDFRNKVENYQDYCNALLVRDSQAATLGKLGSNEAPQLQLLFRRFFTLFLMGVILVPFFVVGLPVGLLAEFLSERHRRRALSESSIKVAGKDVKGSYMLMVGCISVPVVFFLVFLITLLYMDLRTALTVAFSLPMAMYVSLLIFQEAVIELRAALPLFMSVASKHKQFRKLYERRQVLVGLSKTLVSKWDPVLENEVQTYVRESRDAVKLREPSLFSLRHSCHRRLADKPTDLGRVPASTQSDMQAIISVLDSSLVKQKEQYDANVTTTAIPDWSTMYVRKPKGNSTLFELEIMLAKRLELLSWIHDLMNSPTMGNHVAVLDEISTILPQERRKQVIQQHHMADYILLGSDDIHTPLDGVRSRTPLRSSSRSGNSTRRTVIFDEDEDLISHLLARYAFCQTEKWRKWFVKVEEVLLRARLKMQVAKCEAQFIPSLMKNNGLLCEMLSEEQSQDLKLQEYIRYYSASQLKNQTCSTDDFFSVQLSRAMRLIRSRSVLCRRGVAVLHRDQVQEVFVSCFLSNLNRGLHEAYVKRMKLDSNDENEHDTVMLMLDAFLEHFIQDPESAMQEVASGTIGLSDVRRLSQTHFPLCMRQIDEHLRRVGHLKHHGRFNYGLFLKAIGLSLQDSMSLFASLMTQKNTDGDIEKFSKTAYGYNIRHNYGMEGKKMSYSSMSCATLLNLPPVVDKFDCHGCPFRFRDETAFRSMLRKEQMHPLGRDHPPLRPAASDIEDIVQDCKGQHYTRACYKYFMATHPGAKRDALFRSPYEYYSVSCELSEKVGDSMAEELTPSRATTGTDNLKRSMFSPTLNEGVIRRRKSPQ